MSLTFMTSWCSTRSFTFVSVENNQPSNIETLQNYSNVSFFIPPFSMSRSLLSLPLRLLVLAAVAAAHGGDHADDGDGDAPSSESVDLRAKPLILVKIYCLILVFVGTFIGGVSPYFLKWNETFLVLGTQFAGGVFLGTAMMHFLSDSNETFGDLTSVEYPFAFMLACAGYLMTMFADCLVSYVYGKGANGGDGDVELQAEETEESYEKLTLFGEASLDMTLIAVKPEEKEKKYMEFLLGFLLLTFFLSGI